MSVFFSLGAKSLQDRVTQANYQEQIPTSSRV